MALNSSQVDGLVRYSERSHTAKTIHKQGQTVAAMLSSRFIRGSVCGGRPSIVVVVGAIFRAGGSRLATSREDGKRCRKNELGMEGPIRSERRRPSTVPAANGRPKATRVPHVARQVRLSTGVRCAFRANLPRRPGTKQGHGESPASEAVLAPALQRLYFRDTSWELERKTGTGFAEWRVWWRPMTLEAMPPSCT